MHGNDGKYHLYASHWLYTNGFGPPERRLDRLAEIDPHAGHQR